MADHYQTLGVEKGASQEDIKRAYRRLAHQYHPDKEGGDEEKFKQVNEAYQVLGDEKRRSQYDQFGQTFENGGFPGGGFSGQGYAGFEDLGSVFEQFFGGGTAGRSRPEVRRGQDVGIDVTISFAESAFGVNRDITHRIQQVCEHCHGSGAQPNTPIKDCATCQGSGTVTSTRQTMLGVFTQRGQCPTCHGEGKIAETPCSSCKGEGRQMKERTLEIKIPAGIADKQTIHIAGKGEAPIRGGVPGDLYVTVHIKPHKTLRRTRNDVRSSISIPFTDAALGTKVSIETLQGKKEIDIKAGTQPGSEIKLPGLGFPNLRSQGVGDHILTVNVEIPKKLSKKQRKVLEEFKTTKPKRGLFG